MVEGYICEGVVVQALCAWQLFTAACAAAAHLAAGATTQANRLLHRDCQAAAAAAALEQPWPAAAAGLPPAAAPAPVPAAVRQSCLLPGSLAEPQEACRCDK